MKTSQRPQGRAGRVFTVLSVMMGLGCLLAVSLTGQAYGDTGERVLRFYNTHTHEQLFVTYKVGGRYVPQALERINAVLRDHRSDEVHQIDVNLLDLLYELLERLNYKGEVHIISGYRSGETNSKLRKRSSGVAKGSLHMQGKALDFRLPGVDTKKLRDAVRSMNRGGVGYYEESDFIHMDTGRVRTW